MRRGPRVLLIGSAAALAMGMAMSGLVGWMHDSMVFHPTPGSYLRLEKLGLDGEEVWLQSEDGVRLHAFLVRAPDPAGRAILFLHGNAGNASHRLPNAARLAELRADVLLLDYRGYGLSEGRPAEAGLYADARSALAWLRDERGLPEQRIILFGRSLGGAVAVDLAQDRALAGVILESTFSSASAVADEIFPLPLGWLVRARWNSIDKIARTRAPLLFFHGERDQIIPIALGRRLFEAAPEPKQFETLPRAGHNDTVERGGRAYFARIARFLDEVAPPP